MYVASIAKTWFSGPVEPQEAKRSSTGRALCMLQPPNAYSQASLRFLRHRPSLVRLRTFPNVGPLLTTGPRGRELLLTFFPKLLNDLKKPIFVSLARNRSGQSDEVTWRWLTAQLALYHISFTSVIRKIVWMLLVGIGQPSLFEVLSQVRKPGGQLRVPRHRRRDIRKPVHVPSASGRAVGLAAQ